MEADTEPEYKSTSVLGVQAALAHYQLKYELPGPGYHSALQISTFITKYYKSLNKFLL